MISKHNSGLDTMIDNRKFDDLSRLFGLCIMVPTGLQWLRSALKESIIRRGGIINEAALSEEFVDVEEERQETEMKRGKAKGKARPPSGGIQPAIQWVQEVLDLKDKFDIIRKDSFQSSRDVESSINGVSYIEHTCNRATYWF